MTLKLHTIICSTRPGRVGPSIAQWFHAFANEQNAFASELIDLAEFKLPVYDEPVHPAKQQYQHEHTKAWSRSVAAADLARLVGHEVTASVGDKQIVNAARYREF